MEILYIILAFILGAVLAYFILKSSSVSRKSYEELQQNFNQKEADFNALIEDLNAKVRSGKLKMDKSVAYLVGVYQKKGILPNKS